MSQTIEFTQRLIKYSSPTEVMVFKPLLDSRLQGFLNFNADANNLLNTPCEIDLQPLNQHQVGIFQYFISILFYRLAKRFVHSWTRCVIQILGLQWMVMARQITIWINLLQLDVHHLAKCAHLSMLAPIFQIIWWMVQARVLVIQWWTWTLQVWIRILKIYKKIVVYFFINQLLYSWGSFKLRNFTLLQN